NSNVEDPYLQGGPADRPAAHYGNWLVVSDGQYYICIDAAKLEVVWKRRIDANDPTRIPAMRLATDGKILTVLKQDFDHPALHGLNLQTGDLLWSTGNDPKSAPPLYSNFIENGKIYGMQLSKRGFTAMQLDALTGKVEWQWESTEYKEAVDA